VWIAGSCADGNDGNFFTSHLTISFSRRTLPYEISLLCNELKSPKYRK
jgi:hypothetical protein